MVSPVKQEQHVIDGGHTGVGLWRAGARGPSRFVQVRLLAKDHGLNGDEDLE